jgi:undecaprenyl-diphosphatase
MDILSLMVLAIVQGITEFLPISSSGHLILAPHLFGFADQGLAVDVAVHLGSLLAVVLFFRQDIAALWLAWWRSVRHRQHSGESRLAWSIILATVPVMACGWLLKDWIASDLRAPWIIATTTLVFGLLLAWADYRGTRQRTLHELNLRDAMWIGLAQVLALIPGTSRSGITMTAGLWLGFSRQAAARFSFLLSIPTILAASVLVTADLVQSAEPVAWTELGITLTLSAITAYICIHFFLRCIEQIGMWPFVIYRILLAGLIFVVIS